MIKKSLLYTALFAASMTPAMAATNVEWRGLVFLTAVTTACGTDYIKDQNFRMRYRPTGFTQNGSTSRIAFFQDYVAHSYTVNGPFTASYQTVIGKRLLADGRDFDNPTQLKLTSVTPAAPTASTPSIAIVGSITNFRDIAGCNVSFRGAGALSPY